MIIKVKRIGHSRYGVNGQLSINNQVVCHTCEHPRMHLAEGAYIVELHHSVKLRRKAPIILCDDVRQGVFPIIGIGNGPFRCLDGSIIVGHHLTDGVLLHSADTFKHLIDRMNKAVRRGRNLVLVIE